MGGWVEEEKLVRMRCCRPWVGGWVGGWVEGSFVHVLVQSIFFLLSRPSALHLLGPVCLE